MTRQEDRGWGGASLAPLEQSTLEGVTVVPENAISPFQGSRYPCPHYLAPSPTY